MLSPGRVGPDRKAEMKYRNANLLAVAVTTLQGSLSIRLVSVDSGSEVGRIELPFAADPLVQIGVAMVEDWIVCTYRTNSLDFPTHLLVSIYLSQPSDSG